MLVRPLYSGRHMLNDDEALTPFDLGMTPYDQKNTGMVFGTIPVTLRGRSS